MPVKFKDSININGEYTLPLIDGDSGEALITDGAGNISFGAASAASSGLVLLNVKNTSGGALSKGDPVHITGNVGNSTRLEVDAADAADGSKMPAVGILTQDLADDGEGTATITGYLKDIDTTTIDGSNGGPGDVVYVKAGGGLTYTKPTGTNLIQNIAKVGRDHENGSLVVSSIMRTNDVPTPMYVDHANQRLGIGTGAAVDAKLHILGSDIKLQAQGQEGSTFIFSGGNNTSINADINYGNIKSLVTSGVTNAESGVLSFETRHSGTTAERMRITSNGNVGIGVTDPAYKLDVSGDGIRSRRSSAGWAGWFENTADSSGVIVTAGTGSGDAPLLIRKQDGTELFSVRGDGTSWFNNGNVGVGTTLPAEKLVIATTSESLNDVLGVYNGVTGTSALGKGAAIRIGLDKSGSYSTKIATIYEGNNPGYLQPALAFFTMHNTHLKGTEVERMRIASNGNVGIGTTSPLQPFQVDAGTNIASFRSVGSGQNNKELLIQTGGDRVVLDAKNASDGTAASLAFELGNSEKARLTTTGLGIGTTSPAAKLHVESVDNNYMAIFRHSVGPGYAPGSILLEAGQSSIRGQGIYHYNNVANENWFTGVPYNVGSTKWIVANKNHTSQDVSTAQLTHALMTIDSDSGNVGIGTTTPSAKLDVDGEIKSTSATINGTVAFNSLKDTGENITITKFVDEADKLVNNDNDTTIPTSAAVVDHVATHVATEVKENRLDSYKVIGIGMDYLSRVHNDGGVVEGMENVMKNTEKLILT